MCISNYVIKVSNRFELWLLNLPVYHTRISRTRKNGVHFIEFYKYSFHGRCGNFLCITRGIKLCIRCAYIGRQTLSSDSKCLKWILSEYAYATRMARTRNDSVLRISGRKRRNLIETWTPNCIRRHGCCILKFHIQQSRYSNNALIGIILSAPSVPRAPICNKKSIYPHDALSLPSPANPSPSFPLSFALDLDTSGGELFLYPYVCTSNWMNALSGQKCVSSCFSPGFNHIVRAYPRFFRLK